MRDLITAEEIAQATQEQFDSMFNIGDIVRGNNIEMMEEARVIAYRKLVIKASDYDTDTGLRLTAEELKTALAAFLADDFPLDYTADTAARALAQGMFDYDTTGITLAMTCAIVNGVLGTNMKWSN